MTRRTCAMLVLLASPAVSAAADALQAPAAGESAAQQAAAPPGASGSTVPSAPPTLEAEPSAVPASPAAPPPPALKPFSVEFGWGYYEVTHVGVGWHIAETAVLDLFAGGGLAWDAKTVSVGLGFRHDLFARFWTLQAGWDLKAIYWTQSDANYDWKNLSAVLGAYVTRDLDSRLALKLDGGVALSGALQSDRKQNVNFGNPQRWNGSVCLELVYRLGR